MSEASLPDPTVTTDTEPLALYVHWPFCLSKCPYCDFNSHVREGIDHARWRAGLVAELDHYARKTGRRRLTSIFFGGGTPSLMDPETTAAVISTAATHWDLAADAEITLEANPTSVEATRLGDFREAGINRVSLGVQALDDEALKFLGRGHSAAEALAAVATARRIFPRHSFDLIYARPGQSVADWRDELTRALDHVGDHLSVYQLTIEKGTPFYAAFRRGALKPPGEEASSALYEMTREFLANTGLASYEISNHARPGGECRHNLAYWRYDDYVGVGPGAHGRLTTAAGTVATEQAPAPEAWLDRVERDGHATRTETALSHDQCVEEMTMMGLRLTGGLERARVLRRFSADVEALFDPARLAALAAAGYIETDDAGVRATAEGRQRLDSVLSYLLAATPQHPATVG